MSIPDSIEPASRSDHLYSRRIPKRVSELRHRISELKANIRGARIPLLDSTIDRRPHARVTIAGESFTALLDSGASVSCLGRGVLDFLERNKLQFSRVPSYLTTADGTRQSVLGFIYLPITYVDKTRKMRFLIAPGLNNMVFLGIDFWEEFSIQPLMVDAISAPEPMDETNAGSHTLSAFDQERLLVVKEKFPSSLIKGLGKTTWEEHVIDVGSNAPIKQRYYPVSPAVQSLLDQEIDRLLELGVIEESNSAWSSPVVLVKKSDGRSRLCIDVRKVNSVTTKDAYPTPNVEGLLSRIQDTQFISSVDLKDAFWQIPLHPDSRDKTAFTVPNRPLYQFRVMPFGLCNAPQRLCRLMDKVVPHQYHDRVFVYLDDLLIVSPDFESHLKLLEVVAYRLTQAGLTINMSKSKFVMKEIRYLGYIIGNGCLKTDPDKVSAISNFPIPATVRQVRRFLGMTGWYRRFIPNYANLAGPLTDLMRKSAKFTWSADAQNAFEKLKECLCSAPILSHADFQRPFVIQCDASTSGIGGVLYQLDDSGLEHPIAYVSKKLNSAQRNYSITELECLAAVESIKRFRAYVEGHPFKVITDHASLKWLLNQKDLSGRLARWSLKLQAFDFSIEHRKGKLNIVPDALSRCNATDCILAAIDLDSPEFQTEDYRDLMRTVETNKSRLPDLEICNGKLYKYVPNCLGTPCGDSQARLWIPSTMTAELIRSAHDDVTSAHLGVAKTLERLRRHYFWPGMSADVYNYVTSCETCKMTKTPNKTLRTTMGNQIPVERPFQRLCVDLIGPYPRSKSGNVMALVVLDAFTKFVLVKPLRSARTQPIVAYLEQEIFHLFGVPQYIQSDNGVQFVSKEFRQLMDRNGIQHMRNANYSPQENPSERQNRTILAAIRAYLGDDQREWDAHVSQITWAIRNSRQEATGYSPHFLVFGSHGIDHASTYALLRELKCLSTDGVETLPGADNLRLIYERVRRNLEAAHKRYSKSYNTRSRPVQYVVGQEVYRRNFTQSDADRKFCAKLAPRFLPARVIERIGTCQYRLSDRGGKPIGVFHAKDIHA